MQLLLNVPHIDEDEVKSLGAKWNTEFEKWYVPDKSNYHKFSKWFNNPNTNLIICDHIYVVVGEQECFKCNNTTSVISLATDSFFEIENGEMSYIEGDLYLIEDVYCIPNSISKYLSEEYKFNYGHSKTTNSNYYGNHCDVCGVLQGNFYLYCEPDSPFFMDDVEKVKNLKLFKISLKCDLELTGFVGMKYDENSINYKTQIIDIEFDA